MEEEGEGEGYRIRYIIMYATRRKLHTVAVFISSSLSSRINIREVKRKKRIFHVNRFIIRNEATTRSVDFHLVSRISEHG